jgi:hypothetical protein
MENEIESEHDVQYKTKMVPGNQVPYLDTTLQVPA